MKLDRSCPWRLEQFGLFAKVGEKSRHGERSERVSVRKSGMRDAGWELCVNYDIYPSRDTGALSANESRHFR